MVRTLFFFNICFFGSAAYSQSTKRINKGGAKTIKAFPKKMLNINPRDKDKIFFEADLITHELLKDYEIHGEENIICKRVLGKNVTITLDTIFKKYFLIFTDENEKQISMNLRFMRNYFRDDTNTNSKFLLMEGEDPDGFNGRTFFLKDFLEGWPQLHSLELVAQKVLPKNITERFFIKDARRIK